jgi:hypothetical protein
MLSLDCHAVLFGGAGGSSDHDQQNTRAPPTRDTKKRKSEKKNISDNQLGGLGQRNARREGDTVIDGYQAVEHECCPRRRGRMSVLSLVKLERNGYCTYQ